MGNFLAYLPSFQWVDKELNRNDYIDNLNEVIILSKKYDKIFHCENLYEQLIFEILFNTDFDGFKKHFPWITDMQYSVLISIYDNFSSKIVASNILDLKKITKDECAWIGLYSECKEILIHHKDSWKEFHEKVVEAFDLKQRTEKEVYFDEFFIPYLRVSLASINISISRKKINSMFKRIDPPKKGPDGEILHGEKVQIHFADKGKSALNIDGTWKHGKLDLTKDVKENLIDWGFKLPK